MFGGLTYPYHGDFETDSEQLEQLRYVRTPVILICSLLRREKKKKAYEQIKKDTRLLKEHTRNLNVRNRINSYTVGLH